MTESEEKMEPLAQLATRANIQPNTARMAAKRGLFTAEKIGRDWFALPSEFFAWAAPPENHKAGRRPKK